jgi:hypothetical protein
MLTTMTDEAPPEGLETKDVHTMSGGTFQEPDAGQPGYRPAAVPNSDVTNKPAEEQQAEGDEKEGAATKSDSGTSDSSSARKTTSRGGSSKS